MNILAYIISSFMLLSHCPQNNIKDYSTLRAMQDQYYELSPNEFCGFATRYGSDTKAVNELYWEAQEVVAQYEHGYVLLGGNYGWQTIEGREYLLDNRASMGYSKHILNSETQYLTRNQMRLYTLGSMTQEEFRKYIQENYIGVISIKSPNDIGREFCLYSANGTVPVGNVIVGGTAASKDWLLVGVRANAKTIGLGLLKSYDSQGNGWYWAVDLPNSLYYRLNYNGEHPHIRLEDGRCPTYTPRYNVWMENK